MTTQIARLELRIDQAIIDKVDVWRSDQGAAISRSEAIVRLIDVGLAQPPAEPSRPSITDRILLWLQAENLRNDGHIVTNEKIALIQEAIAGGHMWAIEWEFPFIFDPVYAEDEDLAFVVDVLEMWEAIEVAWQTLSLAQQNRVAAAVGSPGTEPKFIGFDHAGGIRHADIASFLVEKMGRYGVFKGRDLHSLASALARHQEMLKRYLPMRKNLADRQMSASELIIVLKAGMSERTCTA